MNGDSASSQIDDVFRIEGWTVIPRDYQLVRPGETRRLQPKPMEVLVYLSRNADRTVSRDELMTAVWPGVYVSEHALNRCVSLLRKLFDDDARQPRVIKTIPKAGYRLISPVEVPGDDGPAHIHAKDLLLDLSARPTMAASKQIGRSRPALLGLALVVAIAAAGGTFSLVTAPKREASLQQTVLFTTDSGVESQAALSPNGDTVAYVGEDENGNRRLYVREMGGDTSRVLADSGWVQGPMWSPDGSKLAFVQCMCAGECRVMVVPAIGGEPTLLVDGPVSPSFGSWSPDGRSLALVAAVTDDGPVGVAIVDLETGRRRLLNVPPPGVREHQPLFSPDGTFVLFARSTTAGADLFRVATEGGSVEQLTFDGRALAGHTWSTDGRSILFSSSRTGVFGLWRIAADGGKPEAVVGPSVRDPGGPVVGQGNRLIVEDWAFEINIWEASRHGEDPLRRVVSTLWDRQPHLSPDGSQIAFVSNRTGTTEIWTTARDGGSALRRTAFRGAVLEHPRFAPDNRRIVFTARLESQSDLYVLDIDGDVRRLTMSPEVDEVAPRWSRDGKMIYFGSSQTGTWQIWKIPTEGGESIQITQDGGYTAEENENGSVLVARFNEAGLWQKMGDSERRVAALPGVGDWGNWAVTRKGILTVEQMVQSAQVVALDIRDGSAAAIGTSLESLVPGEPSLAFSADGSAIIFARIDRAESDLLLVEPFE